MYNSCPSLVFWSSVVQCQSRWMSSGTLQWNLTVSAFALKWQLSKRRSKLALGR